jgi:orotate phosphoribosyltransferase-like protein
MDKTTTKHEQKLQFIELRAKGMSYDAIAKELNISKHTLLDWSRECSREISNARSIMLDELIEQFALSKKGRIEAFGKRLQTILSELDKRDLSAVPVEKLMGLALQYSESLRADSGDLTLVGLPDLNEMLGAGEIRWPA